MLGAMRHSVGVWNYNRIAPEHRPAFVKRWQRDVREMLACNLIDLRVLSDAYLEYLLLVAENPDELLARYPHEMPFAGFTIPPSGAAPLPDMAALAALSAGATVEADAPGHGSAHGSPAPGVAGCGQEAGSPAPGAQPAAESR